MNEASRVDDRHRPAAMPETDGTPPRSEALVPRWLAGRSSGALLEAGIIAAAALLLAALAQVAVPMPGLPVPVTGQSFAVVFLALLLGWARAGATLAAYLGAASSFRKSTMAALLATAVIFLFGAAGLLLYLPPPTVLSAGVRPFLPGAAVKMVLAAGMAHWLDCRFAGAA